MLQAVRPVKGWSLESQDDPSKMHIDALRKADIKGTHTVRYESGLDSISLGHNAKSRDAFAAGVLMAAYFIKGRTGVFGMSDLLNI